MVSNCFFLIFMSIVLTLFPLILAEIIIFLNSVPDFIIFPLQSTHLPD